ncbi:hypothetical protein F5Y02DRAFT_426745 [Annulohypoxylon stygium]|nr:hypothetical protein F5Y02DRAFT_426745 [Annulohypoxylon stygium]
MGAPAASKTSSDKNDLDEPKSSKNDSDEHTSSKSDSDEHKSNPPESNLIVPWERNANFIGYEPLLKQILDRIHSNTKESRDDLNEAQDFKFRRYFIRGSKGIGKTQIALETAYRIHDQYPDYSVLWISDRDRRDRENSLRYVRQCLNLRQIENDPAGVEKLIQELAGDVPKLKGVRNCLLIIDDADISDILGVYTLFDDANIQLHRNISILFTTVSSSPNDPVTIEIPPMRNNEAIDLLQAMMKANEIPISFKIKSSTTKSLVISLSKNPLAIKQVSAYLASNRDVTISHYIDTLMSKHKSGVNSSWEKYAQEHRHIRLLGYNRTNIVPWLVIFEQIGKSDPQAFEYLTVMCLLDEGEIPFSLLLNTSEEEISRAIGTLEGFSFIKRHNPDSLVVDPFTRYALRFWKRESGELQESVNRVIKHLDDKCPSPNSENRSIWARYRIHIEEALMLQEKPSDRRNALVSKLTENYLIEGNGHSSERLQKEMLDKSKKFLGKTHPDTLSFMHNYSLFLCRRKQYEEAEDIFRKTLELRKYVLGESHSDTLDTMNSLSRVLLLQEEYPEAEELCRRTLSLREQILGKGHHNTLSTMRILSSILDRQGKYSEAKEMRCKAYSMGCKFSFWESLFIPGCLSELVDMIFNLLGIPDAEEPLSIGMTRVRWKCGCGKVMYYDTPKQKSDNAYEQARHNANFTSIRSVAKNLINSIIGSLFARPFKRVDLESQNPPVSSAQSGPPSRDDHNGDSGDRYLLFCIDKGTPLHTWHQERMPEDSSHTNVFKFLRKRYRKHRGYYSWFTLKWIRRLFVAEFTARSNGLAQLLVKDGKCSSTSQICICFPLIAQAGSCNKEYVCSPAPEEDEVHPVLPSEDLTHFFKIPHELTDEWNKLYTNQLPKRTDRIDPEKLASVAVWGIYFEEGWHWRTIYLLVSLSLLGPLVFGIVWTKVKGDMGDAFTTAGYLATFGASSIAFLAFRSMEI